MHHEQAPSMEEHSRDRLYCTFFPYLFAFCRISEPKWCLQGVAVWQWYCPLPHLSFREVVVRTAWARCTGPSPRPLTWVGRFGVCLRGSGVNDGTPSIFSYWPLAAVNCLTKPKKYGTKGLPALNFGQCLYLLMTLLPWRPVSQVYMMVLTVRVLLTWFRQINWWVLAIPS